ncbi:MAG TPA: DNA repair and recombination protein RadB [Thermoplasmata archaeon]|nr:DNA repair and recombination protein RadB [Thermoplasmata archaeon]
MSAPDRVPTGSDPIDRLLEGGLEPDGLTEIYGEGGTGKTILCLEAALRVARQDRWVFYIDTEGVSTERVAQMAGGDADRILRRMLISTPPDLARQEDAVHTTTDLARDGRRAVGLIVLDSAVLHYRLTLGTSDEEGARRRLLAQMADLLGCAVATHVPVLFTNQVWRNVSTGTLEPIGGPFLNHLSKTIVRFDRTDSGRRSARLVKHRSLPPREVPYRISERGLESVS